MKKGLSLLLSFLMIISMFSCLSVVASAATSDYELDIQYTVSATTEGTFVAPESGYYAFSSYGDGDPQIDIYNGWWEDLGTFDDTVRSLDFYGVVYLDEDEVAYCEFYNHRGDEYSINFMITKLDLNIESISFAFDESFYLILEENGYWNDRYNEVTDSYEEFFYYNIPSANECYGNALTINYSDGGSDTYVYTENAYYNDSWDEWYDGWVSSTGELLEIGEIYTSDNQAEKPWVVGENELIIEFMGKTTTTTIPVIENPVDSISFAPITPDMYVMIENSNGYWWDEDHYIYSTPSMVYGDKLTVVYNDGRGTVDYILTEEYIEEMDYYEYSWISADGHKLDETVTYMYSYDNQYSEQWVLGSNNFITVEYMYKECKIPVTIIENPVVSIEFTPAQPYEYIEHLDGYWSERYNDETDQYEEFFYYYSNGIYNYDNALTVRYTDGSSRVFVYDYAYVEEYGYNASGWFSADGYIDPFDVSSSSDQDGKPWVVGGNNYFTVEYSGRECQVPVTIKANPVESIEFIPANGSVSVFENTKGYWQGYWDDEIEEYVYTHYEYDFEDIAEQNGNAIKVNYTNGTSSMYIYSNADYEWINENDDILDSEYLYFVAEQDEENNWTIGSNIATVEYCGKTTDVTVKVLEPVDDVTDGNFVAEVINETDCHIIEAYESAVVNGVLTIPESIGGYTVTGMDSWLFYDIPVVKEINLPSGFTNLSGNSFYGYDVLEKVNVAESNPVYTSMNGVVYNKACTDIVYCPPCYKGALYIPAEEEELDGNILVALSNASSVVIDENNLHFAYDDGIIYNADYTKIIKALSLPENYVMKSTVNEIGQYAFSGNGTVKTATINPTVTEISYCAFYDCSTLESIAIPEAVISISYSAFKNTGLKTVTLPTTVEWIADSAFENCGALTSATLNNGLTDIDNYAFANTGLTSIVIPDSVTWVGYKAFYDCDSLTNVVIGSGVGELTIFNFANCDALKEINVPATIEQFSASVIRDCSSLERINVDANNTQYSSIDGVLFDKYADVLLAYPDGKAGEYTIPSSVIDIQGAAFDSASKLTSVVIPDSVAYIYQGTFSGCTALNNVKLSENTLEISYGAFKDCASLKTINIPASVTWINSSAFIGCTALEAINVAESNTEYASQNGMLYNKSKTELVLVACGVAGNVAVPQGTQYIGSFADCEKITSVELPESVTCISSGTFTGCTSLTSITIPDSVTNISYQAFSGCSSLTSIALPSKITRIAYRTFEDCTSLEAIEIPMSVTNIDSYAFDNCISLTDVYFTGTQEQWNNIEIAEGNEYLTNATIHFNSFMPEINAEPTLVLVGDTWYYMAGNKVLADYTGLVNYYNTWYYVENGVLDWNYTGLVNYYNTWYYVSGGVLDWSYTGLVNYYNTWYYVSGGVLDWNYTGLVNYYNTWYYVSGGVLDWNYTGLVNYYNTWYYVSGGVLDWNYTGLVNYYNTWYYVSGGVLDWNYTGLVNYYNTWYYVSGGVLDWSYTGLVNHYGSWYYVAGGVLDWGYTGYVNYYGTNYYITGGYLDWSKQ